MQTETVFENIAERIQHEIGKAKKSVFNVVAWFTNKNLFNELVNNERNVCTVSLIISNDNINLNSYSYIVESFKILTFNITSFIAGTLNVEFADTSIGVALGLKYR